ncbi:glutathione ABC transporter permease GsiD [Mesorhizobium tianshanense]|uniref:Peptide/nickel transport system permease protein/glutathione transport system permease protein n=1 Tax=Mesorhizobium tianshanense TaxID=39844 RepID=A0A562MBR8_9HYPH|nr:ABC transporter permease [Mesorhizobium tianshanense]TWI17272.1 peptide/nickel transport system permease protein/glutathione transport system permease protein [Mesorhizobium tianshanense]GLS35554.1 glutathione ABC transporter permease GsiD [Mesorhizobium tianshanense]
MLGEFLRNLRSNRVLLAATVGLAVFILIAIFAPLIAPHDPNVQNLRVTLDPPSHRFWLGTDEFGRDLASRLIFGARNSLIVGLSVTLLSGLIGTALGIVAGYLRGIADTVTMRAADVMMAFPDLVLALGLIAVLGSGLDSTIIALTVALTPIFVRMVRSRVITVRTEAYVAAAKLIGVRPPVIAARHIMPNVLGGIVVQGALTFAFAVLGEASLSFVGLGVPPPAASFGNIVAEGRDYMIQAPWISISGGVTIMLIVLCFLVLADGVRDAIDPYQRGH